MSEPLVAGRPMRPDRQVLHQLIDEVIDAGWYTNNGALHQRLEARLAEELGGLPLALTSSGTSALILALAAGGLEPGGEVITSPLSFAACAQAIEWAGLRPVFVDVDPFSLTVDPAAVANSIGDRTVGILAVHFLGMACDTAALEELARAKGIWLVFDGAHVLDLVLGPPSMARHGDATAMSLHATKLLHTAEGGFVVSPSPNVTESVRVMRNFGLSDGLATRPGLNAKMSELHAALGLALIDGLAEELDRRQAVRQAYDAAFADADGVSVVGIDQGAPRTPRGLGYYSIRVDSTTRDALVLALADADVSARGSFSLICAHGSRFDPPIAPAALTNATEASLELVSLPFDGQMTTADAERVAAIVLDHVAGSIARGGRRT